MANKINRDLAVILCSHVADGSAPILLAMRTEPEDDYDSGWQVLCNVHEENWEEAKICSVSEILQLEPSLEYYIDAQTNITIMRDDKSSEWRKV